MLKGQSVRALARKLIGPRAARYVRKHFRRTLPAFNLYRAELQGKKALEIGGPSELFGPEGSLPIYDVLQSLDNCLYSKRTIWAGEVSENLGFHYHPKKAPGRQIICEATQLEAEPATYECVLASHCLEHLANPLLGLTEWQRVLKKGGALLLIVPHKDGTFDWRRPTTTLAHMIRDFENRVGEDDLTHLEEILELHDLERDKPAGTPEKFRQRCLANSTHRAMHHHVFDTLTALQVMDYAGFSIVRVDHLQPFHIIILAESRSTTIDNAGFLQSNSDLLSRSPFPSDRRMSSGVIAATTPVPIT